MGVMDFVPESVRQSKLVNQIWLRVKDYQDERTLRRLSSSFSKTELFLEYIKSIDYHNLIQYSSQNRNASRKIFQSLYDALEFNFKGKSFLDLGPGYGDSLDLAFEQGATKVEFVDGDPFIIQFNTLKGFKGYRIANYIMGKGLTSLYPNKYDIILSKGSINADQFNRREKRIISFPQWLDQLENLAALNAIIVICPTFDKGDQMCGGSYYVCKNSEEFQKSWASNVLLDRGFEIQTIEGFNHPIERFPLTFIKKT